MDYQPNLAAAITDAFQSDVFVRNKMDVQHEPIYDTVTIAAAGAVNSTTTALFTNVGPAAGKTLADTNLTRAGELPSPEAFSIMAFRIYWNSDILRADLNTLLTNFAFQFVLGQKPYNTGPLWYYTAGAGIDGFTTRTSESAYTNGLPSREAIRHLHIPIVIENTLGFSASLQGTAFNLAAGAAGGTGLRLTCLLDGLHARGVQ